MPEDLEWLIFMKANHVSHSHDDSEAWEEGTFLGGRIEIVLLFQIYNLERSFPQRQIELERGGARSDVELHHQKVKRQHVYVYMKGKKPTSYMVTWHIRSSIWYIASSFSCYGKLNGVRFSVEVLGCLTPLAPSIMISWVTTGKIKLLRPAVH